jgi:hypothetical protein
MFIDGFSCEVVPRQKPGEKTGLCADGHRFIYRTGSGAWTYLLEPGTLPPLIEEAERRIPVGYSQLWVFEKKFCAAPTREVAKRGLRFDETRREYPRELERHLWPGKLHVVLQDPEGARSGPGTLTYHTELDEALAYAQAQANRLKIRTIVGLLLADVTWH